VARERLPAADLRAGDLQFLPWDDGSFAAVFAANAVQYARDPWAAMRELARVAATGGRVAIGSWGDPEHCEMRHVLRAVAASLPTPPPGKGPFALAEPGALERLVTDAGLSVAARGQADCPFEYETEDLFWRAQRSAGPLQAALGQVEEARLRAAVVASVAPYRTARGGVRLENRFVFVVAGKV
jgi:SAM-dependent methyltransferase